MRECVSDGGDAARDGTDGKVTELDEGSSEKAERVLRRSVLWKHLRRSGAMSLLRLSTGQYAHVCIYVCMGYIQQSMQHPAVFYSAISRQAHRVQCLSFYLPVNLISNAISETYLQAFSPSPSPSPSLSPSPSPSRHRQHHHLYGTVGMARLVRQTMARRDVINFNNKQDFTLLANGTPYYQV